MPHPFQSSRVVTTPETRDPHIRHSTSQIRRAATGVAQVSVPDADAAADVSTPAADANAGGDLGCGYGAMGIAIEDTARHAAAVMRNWEFFRAPLAGIICMHRDLGPADAVSVGMFLQTLLLALTERGLGSCAEVSVTPK